MHPNKESNRNSSSYIDLNNELSPFIEKLNKHSITLELMQADLLKQATQEPKNLEMYMLIEHNAGIIEKHQQQLDENSLLLFLFLLPLFFALFFAYLYYDLFLLPFSIRS